MIIASPIPTGTVIEYTGDNIPNGYVDCSVGTMNIVTKISNFNYTINRIMNDKICSSNGAYTYNLDAGTTTLYIDYNSYYSQGTLTATSNGLYVNNSRNSNISNCYIVLKNNTSSYYRCSNNIIQAVAMVWVTNSSQIYYTNITNITTSTNFSSTSDLSNTKIDVYMWKGNGTIDEPYYFLHVISNGLYYLNNNNDYSYVPNTYTSSSSEYYTCSCEYNNLIYAGRVDGKVYVVDKSSTSAPTLVTSFNPNVGQINGICYKDGLGFIYFGPNGIVSSNDGVTFNQISSENVLWGGVDSNNRILYHENTTKNIKELSFLNYKAISKSTYPDLYAVIGDKYNSHISSLTQDEFAIPIKTDPNGNYKYAIKC